MSFPFYLPITAGEWIETEDAPIVDEDCVISNIRIIIVRDAKEVTTAEVVVAIISIWEV